MCTIVGSNCRSVVKLALQMRVYSLVCGASASRADWPVIRLQHHSSCIPIDGNAAAAEADVCAAISSPSLYVFTSEGGVMTGKLTS